MRFDSREWTYGAEHELADWPALTLGKQLPGFGRDTKDITCVNSNGIANDPTLRYYTLGGEINTPPSGMIAEQGAYLHQIISVYPEAKVNYRSNLHFHIRVPGLRNNLDALKRFALFNDTQLRAGILDIVEPIDKPYRGDYPEETAWRGALRRWKRRRRSHHTILPINRLPLQLGAQTVERFFEAEVPYSRAGRPLWHAQARAAVNLRQLMETDTIEFRHFPGTLAPNKVTMAGLWCKVYTQCALEWEGSPANINLPGEFQSAGGDFTLLPKFEPYVHWQEVRYRATVHDGTLSKEQIVQNIVAIEAGSFDDEYWNAAFNW